MPDTKRAIWAEGAYRKAYLLARREVVGSIPALPSKAAACPRVQAPGTTVGQALALKSRIESISGCRKGNAMMVTKYLYRLRSPWGELPQDPPVAVTPKVHKWTVPWYTSGFE